jgi:hypothetical protein
VKQKAAKKRSNRENQLAGSNSDGFDARRRNAESKQSKNSQPRQIIGNAHPVNSADGNCGIDFYTNIDKFGTGYIEYLTKPLNYSELPVLIETVLTKQSRARA